MTETAEMADVVLPATTFLEHDDCYSAGGHTFFQIAKAVVPPLGECRSNHWVIQQLAMRLEAEHQGFLKSEWELIMDMLKKSGYQEKIPPEPKSFEIDLNLGFEKMHFLDGFGHEDRKFHFKADWGQANHEMPTFPDHWEVRDCLSNEKPYRLITPPARWFLNSTFNEMSLSQDRLLSPKAWMHPSDLKQEGLENAEQIRVGNERGEIGINLEANEEVQPGLVVIEGLWTNRAFPGAKGVNTLTSADAAFPNGGAVFHDTTVWVKAY